MTDLVEVFHHPLRKTCLNQKQSILVISQIAAPSLSTVFHGEYLIFRGKDNLEPCSRKNFKILIPHRFWSKNWKLRISLLGPTRPTQKFRVSAERKFCVKLRISIIKIKYFDFVFFFILLNVFFFIAVFLLLNQIDCSFFIFSLQRNF